MRFELIFQLEPPGQFGLPEEGVTVLPSGDPTTNAVSPVIHARAGVLAGHGTLSRYREDKDQLTIEAELGPHSLKMVDNFVFLSVESETSSDAYAMACDCLERFLRHLCLTQGVAFAFTPLVIEDENRKLYGVPRQIGLGRWTVYNLGQLKESITRAQAAYAISDERLDRALEYYEHATFLYARRQDLSGMDSPHFRSLIASVFLNVWKAVSAVIGDPSRDSDYQRRYRAIGLSDDFFQTRIEAVRALRNDYDVAHYTLDSQRLAQIEQEFGQAQVTAREVISRYRDKLIEASSSRRKGK